VDARDKRGHDEVEHRGDDDYIPQATEGLFERLRLR